MLSWDRDEKLVAFQHMPDIFATDHIPATSTTVHPLPRGREIGNLDYEFQGQPSTLSDYLARQHVTGLLVLKDGQIVLERYLHGLDERTHWTSWSIGKSVVSTILGIALRNGDVGGLNDPVTDYIPELVNSAYAPVTLRDMVQMSSGVAWSEDPTSDEPNVRTFASCLARQEPGSVLTLARALTRATDSSTGLAIPPGARFNYNNVEAFLVGLAIERATGERLSTYFARHVWHPFGMESDLWWMSESPGGTNSGAGDFSATLRDYGRLGQFVLDDGVLLDGTRTLPSGWMTEATSWAPHTASPEYPDAQPGRYGYFWWNHVGEAPSGVYPGAPVKSGSTFAAAGLFGQYIFVDRASRTVMVQWSVYDTPPVDGPAVETATLFNAIVHQPL
ncbi:MAG: serine hydrolase domain-containing protein [Actinomycetaceae bacterium]